MSVRFDLFKDQLDKFSEKHGLTPRQTAKIMLDVSFIKGIWEWLDCEDFLYLIVADENERISNEGRKGK